MKKITARELALLLAKLSGADTAALARAVNIPLANWNAWMAGSSKALRTQDVVSLMAMLGLEIRDGKFWLSAARVHFWSLNVPAVGSLDDALSPLTLLSPWLGDCAITRVAEAKGGRVFLPRQSDTWLIGSTDAALAAGKPQVSLVVKVTRPAFRSAPVSPAVIRGASWLYDDKKFALEVSPSVMRQLATNDLTVSEFKRVFAGADAARASTWEDVALAARQFNIAPDDVIALIRREHEQPGPDVPTMVSGLGARPDVARVLRAVGG